MHSNTYTKTIAIILCALVPCIISYSSDFQVNGIHYNILSIEKRTCVIASPMLNTVGTVTAGANSNVIRRPNPNLYSGDLIIPQNPEFRGHQLTVVGIEDCAFYMCSGLISISIPATVETIGELAFYGCKNLTKVSGPINASIGMGAFAGCTSLRDINLGKCTRISPQAFDSCKSLASVIIPASVKIIEEEAFANCGNLSKVEIKNGSTTLSIKKNIFNGSPIKDLYIGRNLTYWTNSAHDLPFDSIVTLTIGDNVTSVCDDVRIEYSLGPVDNLKKEAILKYKTAFDSESLKTVVLGKSLTSVPSFEHAKLERIILLSATPPEAEGAFSFYSILNSILIVPPGAIGTYKTKSPWKDFTIQEQL